jgi:hypothetical protein
MLGMSLHSPGTLICQTEELCDILDVVSGELLQHVLIPHTQVKYNYGRRIGDVRYSVTNLEKPLDEGVQ